MNKLIIKHTASPVEPTMDFIMVQDFNVSETLNPKYLFVIQNPESFTCEKAVPPLAIAIVVKPSIASLCSN